jgi:hypothetical protein
VIDKTVRVRDWVPAFPPIDATIGIIAAKTRRDPIVDSKKLMIEAEIVAVIKFTKSQGILAFTEDIISE